MNVFAVSTSRAATWRWRIVDLQGDIVEESPITFLTMGQALTAGAERLEIRRERDRPAPAQLPWHRRK
ncbi:MAG TPA: hypothetical protein VHT71_07585 [Methylomirabilota bacterium]|jgi:hypothetical protein|nr:hypothetical protein [Methylomirabilota bacterium]